MPTPSDISNLRKRVLSEWHQGPDPTLRVIAAEILERHHRAGAREIAKLLLDAAGVEVGP